MLQTKQRVTWLNGGLSMRLNYGLKPNQTLFLTLEGFRNLQNRVRHTELQTADTSPEAVAKLRMWFPGEPWRDYPPDKAPTYNFAAEAGFTSRLFEAGIGGAWQKLRLAGNPTAYLTGTFNQVYLRLGYRLIHPPKPQKQDPYFMKSKRRD